MAESSDEGAGGAESGEGEADAARSGSEFVRPFSWVASVAVAALLGTTGVLWIAYSGGGDATETTADAGGEATADTATGDADASSALRVDSLQAVDLSGVWAEKTVQTSVTDVPVVGQVEARSITHRRVEIDQRGDTLDLRSTLCDTSVESNSSAVQTIIPDAYVDSAPPQERQGTLELGEQGRARLSIPRRCGVRGADVDDPASEELPKTPDDGRVVDADGDGYPGVTIRIEGTISGRMGMVQRGCDTYQGTLQSEDRIRGTVEWSTEQNVLKANSMFLRGRTAPKPHSNPERSWFEMTRVEESTGCETILENSDELF